MNDNLRRRFDEKPDPECDQERQVISAEPNGKGLPLKRGWLVYDSGGPVFSEADLRRWMEEGLSERMDHVARKPKLV